MKLFNNPKKAVYVIVAILVLFLAYKANASEVEFGPTYTGEFNGGAGLIFTERFGDKIDLGIALFSDQEWDEGTDRVNNNGMVFGSFIAPKPESWWTVLPSEVQVGAGMWFKEQNPINGCYATFHMGLKWYLGDRATVNIRHWSNGGVCKGNRGQDILTFGWRF